MNDKRGKLSVETGVKIGFISRISLLEFKTEFLKPMYSPINDENVEVILADKYIQVIINKSLFRATALYFSDFNVDVREDGVSVVITSEKWREYMAQKFGDEYIDAVAEYLKERINIKRKLLNDEKIGYQKELRKLRALLKMELR